MSSNQDFFDYMRAQREQTWATHHANTASLASVQPNAPVTAAIQAAAAHNNVTQPGAAQTNATISANLWRRN